MQAPVQRELQPPMYQEHDLIPIPDDIPELGIARGDTGVVKDLDLRNDTVVATVMTYYSTGHKRGLVEMNVRPETKVVSYTTGS